jgi:hypothetical protein
VGTPPSNLPPPPPIPPPQGPPPPQTQIVGQQTAPSSSVPAAPDGSMVAAPGTKTNSLAVVSLVAGIGSFFAHIIPGVGGFTVALVAVITGHMARRQIRQTGEQGMGMATAGMIIGYVHITLLVLLVIAIILIFVVGIAILGISSRSTGH